MRNDSLDIVHGAASFGLACWQGAPTAMTVAHRHDDLEFNVSPGALDYLVDGRSVRIPPRTLAVFWAARPHQLVTDASRSLVSWLTVPLGTALGWRLPGGFVGGLLAGGFALVSERPGLELADRVSLWAVELASGGEERRAAGAEIEGFARRAALAVAGGRESAPTAESGRAIRPDAAAMAAWITEHAGDDVPVADVARHVHLAPQHAMTVFRRALGITIGEYLAQCRVARAQHLLLTTELPVPEVGHAAGFRSQSQFYARFRERCGEPPAAYRRRLRP
ncbi:AraC family transcriptional regulator [Agromyces luteolus]|uniref:Helix-turn-helix domain-containing protein n=1 Tax=Agromyces luteolus TaxID=88373 RepID=A0A7C9I0R0_9MICO|nr:helix-turn-helix domain-containing protein [Agromyces luteolus]MUN07920.1 helix-turn-helix domain-containing protein [Agromyces luteolus]GLK28071.1 AraC family transcriptional regulator [Agromyces luteolus]